MPDGRQAGSRLEKGAPKETLLAAMRGDARRTAGNQRSQAIPAQLPLNKA